jgi:hypothetical protein
MILTCIVTASATRAAAVSSQAASNCVAFSSSKIVRDETAVFPLQQGLEFRMVKFGLNGWRIEVGPRGDPRKDYLWAVSPPYRSAPHRQVGPGYGLDAHESATLTPRELRYVVTNADYEKAIALVVQAESGDVDLAGIEALGRGALTLRIAGFGVDEHTAAPFPGGTLEWVAVTGQGCVPE